MGILVEARVSVRLALADVSAYNGLAVICHSERPKGAKNLLLYSQNLLAAAEILRSLALAQNDTIVW